MAVIQIKKSITLPVFPNLKKHMGVYVPAIDKNIEQWSKTRNTFFALHIPKEWYKVEIK